MLSIFRYLKARIRQVIYKSRSKYVWSRNQEILGGREGDVSHKARVEFMCGTQKFRKENSCWVIVVCVC